MGSLLSASEPSQASVVDVLAGVDVQALSSLVSDVMELAWNVGSSLGLLVLPWSDDGPGVEFEFLVDLARKGVVSLVVESDGVGSGVEDEQLSLLVWVIVSQGKEELVLSQAGVHLVDCLLAGELGSDRELNSIGEHWLSADWAIDVQDPLGDDGTAACLPLYEDVSIVLVAVEVKAEALGIFQLLGGALLPGDVLVDFVLEGSHVNLSSVTEGGWSLVRQSQVFVAGGSDRLGSAVEHPPLVGCEWVVVTGSHQLVFVPSNCSASLEVSSSNLELDSVDDWENGQSSCLSNSLPSLVEAIVALVPDEFLVVGVTCSNDIEASLFDISNVLDLSWEPSDLLELLTVEWSSHSLVVVLAPVVTTELDRQGEVSVAGGSDGLGSAVEHPPLVEVSWLAVSDSQSSLTLIQLLSDVHNSATLHKSLDLESDSVGEWVLGEFNSLSFDVPALVGSAVAWPEDDVSVVLVGSSVDIKAKSGVVSDVPLGSWEEGDFLVWFADPWSENGLATWSVLVASLVGDGVVSLFEGSD